MLEWSLSNLVQKACHPVSDTCIHMYVYEGGGGRVCMRGVCAHKSTSVSACGKAVPLAGKR